MVSAHDEALDAAVAAIRAADSIVAVGHVRPDGDALGASLALALAARDVGKQAHVTYSEPFAMPDQFRFLDASPHLPVAEVPTPFDLLIACDTADRERLGTADVLTESADRVLVVDHHISNGGFGDVAYIDSSASATAEMAYRIIKKLDWKITAEVANALYVGVVTDTGRFQYSMTTPAVHEMTAELLAAGVRPEVVGRHVYEEAPFGFLNVAGAVLGRAQLDEERGLVWSVLYPEDLTAAGIDLEHAEGLIDLIRVAQEAGVACLLKVVDGVTKGSLRSRGEVDVAAIANTFGGGGHHNASGFTSSEAPDRVIEMIRQQL
ncbi:MAG: bifunctional oligoribonuclease/PAP phosphatase NrnA [Acidimicrobiia bacterium]|nr:bifunctional oligoribonuclease/PAP phosphatase NrnA [Acidimicrobiia bacterium]